MAHFGRRYSAGTSELKGKKMLKRKVFQHSRLNCEVLPNEARALAKATLDDGATNNTVRHFKALALAKIGYVTEVFSICERRECKPFASIIAPNALQSASGGLRKDYAYLFERFFYFLEDKKDETSRPQQGILVFDELEKAKSHLLIDQAHRYFKETKVGRLRSTLVIPEPFFVHSDLTTGIQIADLVAYCISWGFRLPSMHLSAREELESYSSQLKRLRHRSRRDKMGNSEFGALPTLTTCAPNWSGDKGRKGNAKRSPHKASVVCIRIVRTKVKYF